MNKDAQLLAEAYSEISKTENIDIDTLIDAIKQNQIDKGNKEFANAHVIGALGFLIKRALQNPKSLQDDINRTYQSLTENK